ncbi:MAG: aspartate/tyrosine/aromatic aminotransferase [Propionibacteriaceae bacterium]|jgi:aromatic-amino-acid transaminase|nr:aspartate/tyrosine/aromatic aminotransferase [Propionibacteriaceae bacterium]
MSVFSALPLVPPDPVLGVTEAFQRDLDPAKINLGVGVYQDEDGRVPVLDAVRRAQARLADDPRPYTYLPISGLPVYNEAVKQLVFSAAGDVVAQGRVVTIQALGGTGGLRVGAGLLALIDPTAQALVSNPTWENHQAVFQRAGLAVRSYRYLDAAAHRIDFDGLIEDLAQAAPGSVVVLHACCHNPTGYDLGPAEWDQVVAVCAEAGLVPFLDMAYQGFSQGIVEDAAAVAKFAAAGLPFLVATSFSKSFSLYGERVGAISFVTADAAEAERVQSQAKVVVRTLYSNPPTHGARLVSTVLGDRYLRAEWENELSGMRDRIKGMRALLRAGLERAGAPGDLSYITDQTGMFSYSGLSQPQMERLRRDFHVYGLDSGRLCVAALNHGNIDAVVRAVAEVMA